MNDNRQFDEHIREQFSNFSPDVHPRIWENIMAERNKRKPAGFWLTLFNGRNKLLLAGLIIALSTGGALIYFNINAGNKNPATAVETKNNKPASGNIETGIQNDNKPSDQTINLSVTNTEGEIPANNPPANLNPALTSASKVNVGIYSPSTQLDDDGNSTTDISKRNKKTYTGLGSVLINTTSPGLTEDEEDEFEGQGTMLGRLNFSVQKYLVKQKIRKTETLSFNPITYFPDCPSFEKDASGNKKYFEFYLGADYAIRSLHDTGNSAYLQKRKESTKFQSAFSAGVRYTKVFNNSMSVRGGVNYSQINEKFTFVQGNLIQVTYIINANGDTIGSYTTTGTRYKTTINRYRSIDIPIVVGYEVGNGKWHANINAGAVVNIYSWQKGDVLDTAGRPVSITTGKNSSPYQFKTNAGIGFIGAVSVYYKLTDKLHLMAEPYFRYNFSPMNKETITLKQKYQTAGLRLGIRLDLK